MKKQLFTIMLALLPMIIWAEEIEIDGLKYNVVGKTKEAEVIGINSVIYVSSDVVIPETITYGDETYRVTKIGGLAFYQKTAITSITIPPSISFIGNLAFGYCLGLKAVYISDIDAWCRIIFESSPLAYAQHLYLNGDEVIKVVIPNDVTNISPYSFAGCYSLETIVLHDKVVEIGKGAFSNCKNLKTIELPDGLVKIEDEVFANSGITSIVLPNSITTIGDGIFRDCISLSSVQLSDNVTKIGKESFENCSTLTTITIPNKVETIGWRAFAKCVILPSIDLPDCIKEIGEEAFSGCANLSSVKLSNSIKTLSVRCFYDCPKIEIIDIPSSVTKIDDAAFYYCDKLKTIYIGQNVNSINAFSFSKCSELSDVYCYSSTPPSCDVNSFYESYIDYATLHVPASSITDYKESTVWNGFKDVVAINDSEAGFSSIKATQWSVNKRYDLNGRVIKSPHNGINIIRMNNGKTRKVLFK